MVNRASRYSNNIAKPLAKQSYTRWQSGTKFNCKLYYETFKINSKTCRRNFIVKNIESFYRIPASLWLRANCGRVFRDRLTANAKVATASSARWIKYKLKKQKILLFTNCHSNVRVLAKFLTVIKNMATTRWQMRRFSRASQTAVGFLSCVNFYMCIQGCFINKRFQTVTAGKRF